MSAEQERIPSVFSVSLIQGLAAVVLFIALVQHHLELILLTALILTLTLGARLWARCSSRALVCRTSVDKTRAFPGDRLNLDMEVENNKLLPVRLHLDLAVDPRLLPLDPESAASFEFRLFWFQRARFRHALSAGPRGVYRAGTVGLRVSDLFGFYPHSQATTNESCEIIVYPRLAPLQPGPLPRRELFGKPGGMSPVTDPVFMLGTREYQPGGPSRLIHWKASARHGRLQEKIFEPSHAETILIGLEATGFWEADRVEAFEQALETAAALAVRLDREGARLGLLTNAILVGGQTKVVPLGRHPLRLQSVLEVLARAEMKPEQELIQLIRTCRTLSRNMACLCFSHSLDERTRALDHHLFRRNIPGVFVTCTKKSDDLTAETSLRGKVLPLESIRLDREAQG